MRNSNSRQPGSSRRTVSTTDSIIVLPTNRLSLPQQQNANSSLGIFQPRIFGPVSYPPQLKFDLFQPFPEKLEKNAATKGQKVEKAEDENANGRHVFLMDNSKDFGEHSQEITETERADRALFMQKIMLSLLQKKN